jgi:hypothetical protein
VWNGHDIGGILAMVTDDVLFEASFGRDPWGSRVVEWVTSGTPRAAGRFETHGRDLLTLRDGQIAAKRSYRKATL